MHECNHCSPGESNSCIMQTPLGMYQHRRVGMIPECCSPGELLARAALIDHDDNGRNALKHYAALRGLEN